ncbi:hypothetical protein CDCA_CDCA01G0221 [Cyanidium caldarium]|uniref:Uncharacterized protein n=1 Tax=Cyanidium caldarium TaxID=2771 RepID=A0AAV9IQ44_CYACA|nr:hypothetical protein CDCA_CDCA01G0221 [Cyanidium caldarium]
MSSPEGRSSGGTALSASLWEDLGVEWRRAAVHHDELFRGSKEWCAQLLRELDQLAGQLNSAAAAAPEDAPPKPRALPAVQALRQASERARDAIGVQQKKLNASITKYTKFVDKHFAFDPKRACRGRPLDRRLLERAIVEHLYREGEFELGERLAHEAQLAMDASLIEPYVEMHQVLKALDADQLEPAIDWARRHRQQLWCAQQSLPIRPAQSPGAAEAGQSPSAEGTELEFKLHRLQFVNLLQQGKAAEALRYAERTFPQFQRTQHSQIQHLMGCFLFASRILHSRLSHPRYAPLFTPALKQDVVQSFKASCWRVLGLAPESPLHSVASCGAVALPLLIKAAKLLPNKDAWDERDELPVEVDLGRPYQFHSIFVCPVSRDQSTEQNPPMLLPCGHVLCKETVGRLPRGGTRFKCPYCPSEQQVAACRQVRF